MRSIPLPIQRLIREFNKLPGIGSKTSERFVFHLLRQPTAEIEALARSLHELKDTIRLCSDCFTVSENDFCGICENPERSKQIICVVAEPKDVMAFEKTGTYSGVYHVLGGVIDHAHGTGPDQLRIKELLTRVASGGVTEIILATNPDMEGETTAAFIAKQLKDQSSIQITKIARGLPMGGNIEFADEITLGNAMSGRQNI
ncbi:MAG: recombination protein RecR [Candidatus Kerfeldbacteria bacterium CG15_BIG_FIL_POST_REV_8_21_14_020_45_12]|uniref:Recombination protein RecR n=1 Tax=Candidatus Kerfeldbacteria bacterium CG15_BIG_FIL_POST_REV_8_21_14_020_45_12 TaxID=2014247 RepID=A0A2M7H3S6_9BACT|nr:MAG: recombination protein RecR [Candidatus Kerfeldbacteria bacterium CG15_BIG_FIL_POST_REV_8_21_14_020_45_12]PJA94010.1 MAG: recombination protein RecR [Candidatus Kerfeldbacteria bacterium CG_4_9_14_3_um_filter_45_8]